MTSEQLLNTIHRELGSVAARIDGLTDEVQRSREDSTAGRQRLYARIEAVEKKVEAALERVATVETAQQSTATTVAAMKPTYDALSIMRQRGIGAVAVIGLAMMIIGGVISSRWEAVRTFFRSLTGGS